ncbi:copper(I)-binding protein [Bradyrhizobium barranii subsp. barranii]
MNTRTLAAALVGATLFGLTAAQAAPKPKAKQAGAVTVTVTNSRKADLARLIRERAPERLASVV